MGLIKAIGGAIRGEMADQWKEYFYCDALVRHFPHQTSWQCLFWKWHNKQGV